MAWLSIPTLLHDPVHGYHEGYYRGIGDDVGLFLFRVPVEGDANPWRVAETLHPFYTADGIQALHPAPYTYGGQGVLGPVNPRDGSWFVFHSLTLGRKILSNALTEPYLVLAYDTTNEYASGSMFWDWPAADLQPGQVVDLYPRGLAQNEKRITCNWVLYEPAACYQRGADDWPAGCYYCEAKGKRVFVGSPQWICTRGPFLNERFVREPVADGDGSESSSGESSGDEEWTPSGVQYRPFVGTHGHRIVYWIHDGFFGWRIDGENGVFYLSAKPPNVVRRWTAGTPSETVVFEPKKLDENGNIVPADGNPARIQLYNFTTSRMATSIFVGETSIWR